MKAEALSRTPGNVGALAFSRSGDPATGDFGDAELIRKFGDVPDDLDHTVTSEYVRSESARMRVRVRA